MKAFALNLLLLNLLVLFTFGSAGEERSKLKSKSRNSYSPAEKPVQLQRTFISDIIGFSALKFLLILGVPLIFSIFIGAMLVLLFPFPLITSTAGLAGAAAVGRRQGRKDDSNDVDEFDDILEYLGLKEPPLPRVQQRVIKPFEERCVERFACEVGKTATPDFRGTVNQIINEIPRRNKHNWKSVIQAYLQGSQGVVNHGKNLCPKYKCRL